MFDRRWFPIKHLTALQAPPRCRYSGSMHSFGCRSCCRATTHGRRSRQQSLFLVGRWRGVWHTPSSFSREELASLHSLVGGQVSEYMQTKENLMQKKLLGMAVAAALAMPAVALAQSAVQVYGTVHLSVNQAKYTKDTAGTLNDTTKYGVTSHASNWGLRSTETLGGGMTAWFQAEFNMKMTHDNGTFDGDSTARNSGVGLRGNFGNFYLGTLETPWAQTFRLWDVGTIGGWGPTTSIIGRREQTGSSVSHNCVNMQSASGGTLTATPTAQGLIGNQLIAGANV